MEVQPAGPADLLAGVLRRAATGAGTSVLLTGEPGIGKTHLLDHVATLATAEGMLLRRGAPGDPDGEPLAVLAVLDEDHGPRVALLDDLQWAGVATAARIEERLRAGVPRRALLVLADRRQDAPWAADRRVGIGPWTAGAAAPLLERLPPRDRAEAFRLSGGNPFLLGELARAGRVPRRPGDPVPGAVAEAVHAEVEQLGPEARLLLRGAAVAGDEVDEATAVAAAGLPDAATALEGLLASALVRRVGGVLRFRSPLVRWAVYAGAGPGWRFAAHARVDAVLATRGAGPRERAVHLERCAPAGDRDAGQALAAAAEGAAGDAPADAARWYAAALRTLPADEAPGRRAALQAAAAVAEGLAGGLDEARAALREPPEVPAAAVAFDVTAGWLLGRHRSVEPLRASAPVTPVDTALLGLAEAEHALVTRDPALLDRAVAARLAARATGDAGCAAFADVLLGLAEYRTGRVDAALVLAGGACAAVDGLPDAEIVGRLPSLFWLGRLCLLVERCADAERQARRGRALADRTGQAWLEVTFGCALTAALARPGMLADAAEVARRTHAAAGGGNNRQDVARALAARIDVAVAAGDLRAAPAWGAEANAAAAGLDPGPGTDHLALQLARVRRECGETDAEPVLAAAGGPGLANVDRPDRPAVHEVLAHAAAVAGDLAAAEEWAQRAEAEVLALPLAGPVSAALRARAVVDLAAGRARAAADAAIRAEAAAGAAGLRVDAGRAGILAGRALAAAGDEAGAATVLNTAHRTLSACGAHRVADEAAQLLRGTGRRPERAGSRAAAGGGPDGVAGLSPRERDVAELVAEGLTNRQIAARLFVSDKTVEAHLAGAFRKLGVRSRAAVAAALR